MSEKKDSPELICVVCGDEILTDSFKARDQFEERVNESKLEYVHRRCKDKRPNQGRSNTPVTLE